MERSPESAWGSSSPERGADSSSGSSSKEGKSKKSSEAGKVEQPAQPQPAAAQLARIFGREALQPATNKEVVIPLRAEKAKDEPKEKAEQPAAATNDQRQESSTVEQEREVAAEVVDEAQAQNEQEASRATDSVEQAAAENVGQLLDNMEDGLESSPPEETAERIIDRATDEAAEALGGDEPPAAEMRPLDWPQYPPEAQREPLSPESTGMPLGGQPEQLDRLVYDDDPDQATTSAPYMNPGTGQGAGGGRPPRGPAAGFNPNAVPPFGAVAPAVANMVGARIGEQEAHEGLVRGFLLGVLTGGIVGHWLGRRGERAKAERAMTKQEKLHQAQVTKYESRVAESQARIRTLTERQAYAARQVMQATEVAQSVPHASERPVPSGPAEARPAEMKTNAPKRVEMMTDPEVHEASRNIRIGDKTLYELKENGTIDATEERTLLRLAEQGGIEDPVRKYHFDQEARRVLMRHELDPQLAQQVLQQENDKQSSSNREGEEQTVSVGSLATGQYSPVSDSPPRTHQEPTEIMSASLREPTSHAPSSHPLVIANVVAVCILVGLLLVLLIVSIIR